MSCGQDGGHGRDPCGGEDLSPRRPDNRPGLRQIAYRVGTHAAFLERMLWRIPRQEVRDPVTGATLRPLAPDDSAGISGLSARDTADPSVALMDAWAATLDVLTFYQERIANEGYFATANERLSGVALARSIGYEPAPGVAASAYLAFTVEDSDDPFRQVEVAEGTQVLSVPQAKGELPQVFETVEAITARAEWNAIKARTERVQNLVLYHNEADANDDDNDTLFLVDVDNSFDFDPEDLVTITRDALPRYHPVVADLDLTAALDDLEADAQLNPDIDPTIKAVPVDVLRLRGTGLNISEGERIVAVGLRPGEDEDIKAHAAPFRVVAVTPEPDYDMTGVQVVPLGRAAPPRKVPRLRFRPPVLKLGVVPTTRLSFDSTNVGRQVRRASWSGSGFSAFMRIQRWPRIKLMRLLRQPEPVEAPPAGAIAPGIHILRQTLGFFGNTAPRQESLGSSDEQRGSDPYTNSWDRPKPDGGQAPTSDQPRSIWTDSQGVHLSDAHAYLEREVAEVVPDSWIVLETPDGKAKVLRVAAAQGESRADFALSGKATGLTLRNPDGSDFTPFADGDVKADLAAYNFRTARARVQSEGADAAGLPIRDDVGEEALELSLDSLYLDLVPGRAVSISGERADAQGVTQSETLVLRDIAHTGGITRLKFETGTTYSYRLPSVRVNANVASATHGEGFRQVLGSGDATRANQTFKLSKTPLTFVPASNESGAASTLTVRVNGVEWAAIGSLYDAGPDDEVYMLRIDDDGTSRVVFGDGRRGKRLPTGDNNVEALYRSGMGFAGEVGEGALIQLKTRPQGVRAVVNPSAAGGAAEAESLDELRERGPQSVRTLGRIVSLSDYADFARTFAGVGKARADVIWRGAARVVHLTAAPASGGVFEDSSQTLSNLREAIETLRDPAFALQVAGHAQRLFTLAAKVKHDTRHLADDVEAAVRAALETAFGFAARDLAQPVSAAEVIAVIQGVAGVVGVDLDTLAPYSEDADAEAATPGSVLVAQPARLSDEDEAEILPAELLTILAAGVELTMEEADGGA